MLREFLGVLALVVGVALVAAAMIAAGWWAFAFLGGGLLVPLGLLAISRRLPTRDGG